LQADLDSWLRHYNHERPHLGYRNQGRRPWETGRNPQSPFEIIAFAKQAGGNPARTIMGHIERRIFVLEDILRLADHGYVMEFDIFGWETSHFTRDRDCRPRQRRRADHRDPRSDRCRTPGPGGDRPRHLLEDAPKPSSAGMATATSTVTSFPRCAGGASPRKRYEPSSSTIRPGCLPLHKIRRRCSCTRRARQPAMPYDLLSGFQAIQSSERNPKRFAAPHKQAARSPTSQPI
jgi:hypothetical protein